MNNLVNNKNKNIHVHNNPFLSPALIIQNSNNEPYIIYDPLSAHNLDFLRRILDTTAHGLMPFINYLTTKYPNKFHTICKRNPFTLDKNNCIKSINTVMDIYLLLKILRDFYKENTNLKNNKLIIKNVILLFNTRNKFSHSEHLKEDLRKKQNPNMVHSLRNNKELLKYVQTSINLLELLVEYQLKNKENKKINSCLLTLQSTYNIIQDSIKIKERRDKMNNENINVMDKANETLNKLKKKLNTGTCKERENIAKSILNLITARMT
jgi:hypothetical protein